MAEPLSVTRLADGVYRIEHDGRSDIVYVTGSPPDRWAFWNGHVFRDAGHGRPGGPPYSDSATADGATHHSGPDGLHDSGSEKVPGTEPARRRAAAVQSLTAPMPATVIKVLVTPGSVVKKGDTVIVLEAMKMELPVRAPADGTVAAVHCREGELVQADTTLIELT